MNSRPLFAHRCPPGLILGWLRSKCWKKLSQKEENAECQRVGSFVLAGPGQTTPHLAAAQRGAAISPTPTTPSAVVRELGLGLLGPSCFHQGPTGLLFWPQVAGWDCGSAEGGHAC